MKIAELRPDLLASRINPGGTESPESRALTPEDCSFLDEADRIVERIAGVEEAFSSRHGCDWIVDDAAGGLNAGEDVFEIGNGKVQVLQRMEFMLTGIAITIGNRIVAGEDGAAAVEVVAARRDT